MRPTTLLPALLAVGLAGSTSATDIAPAPARTAPLLLRGAEVHTVSGGILANHDVLVVDGSIAAIGTHLEAPADAEVLDLAGQQLYPGFIALQTTLGLREIDAVRASVDSTEIGKITPEVAAHVAWNPDSELLPTIRRKGIAIVQSTPVADRAGGALLSGRSLVVRLDGWTKEDAGLNLTWGQQLRWPAAAVRTGWWAPAAEVQRKRMAEDRAELTSTFDEAAAYHAARSAGAVAIDLRLEALRPVISGAEPLFVVANDARQIGEALDFVAERDLRMVLVGGAEAPAHAARLAATEVPVVLEAVHSLPYREDAAYDDPYTLPARLASAGVTIAFANPGAGWDARNIPFQAGHAVGFGLDRETAIRALTLDPARILGIADRVGSIEVGKEATLVAGRGDLLDPLTHEVTLLLIRGRKVELDDRQERLYRKYLQRDVEP